MPRAKKNPDSPSGIEPASVEKSPDLPTAAKAPRVKKSPESPTATKAPRAKKTPDLSTAAKAPRVKKSPESPPVSEPPVAKPRKSRSKAAAVIEVAPAESVAAVEPVGAVVETADVEASPAQVVAQVATVAVTDTARVVSALPAGVRGAAFPPSPTFPATNYALVERLLVNFVACEVRKVGLSRAVLGLSGGVDSAVSAAIATRALGAANVLGVVMPYKSSSPESADDARAVAGALGIETLLVDISAQVDSYFDRFPDASRLRRGNKMARERMTVLYDQSAALSALVIGTSNKTELLLGYGTLYGDMASALNPIGDLYKTQVWGLANHLGIPSSVIEKAPTADLWAGQTDENELGFSYREVDRLLYWMIDERCSQDELLAMGFERAFIERIAGMVRSSQFKRRLPVIAKISARTVDPDFRYARDWGL